MTRSPYRQLPLHRKLMALGGFLFLGVSPTYLEWQEQPDKRRQIVVFYAVATGLFWFGLLQ